MREAQSNKAKGHDCSRGMSARRDAGLSVTLAQMAEFA
jgi:hypothetical protein